MRHSKPDGLIEALSLIEDEGYEVDYGHYSVGPAIISNKDALIKGEFQFSPENNSLIFVFSAETRYSFNEASVLFLLEMKDIFEDAGGTFDMGEDGAFQFMEEVDAPELFEYAKRDAYKNAFDQCFYAAIERAFLCVHALKAYTRAEKRGIDVSKSDALDPVNLSVFCLGEGDTLQ